MAVAQEARPGGPSRPHSLSPEAISFRRKELEVIRKIPLLEKVPLPHERKIDAGRAETADHELNHTLTALSLGVGVSRVSVIPHGNTLGVTELSGGVDSHNFQIIAAAGAVDTVFGSAKGYGSDMRKVLMIHHYEDGMSPGEAHSKAKSRLLILTPEVKQRAAEIIAFLGDIPGSMIPDVIERAKFEIDMEKKARGEPKVPDLFDVKEIIHIYSDQFEEKEEKTKIVHNKDNTYTIISESKNGEKKQEDYCTSCATPLKEGHILGKHNGFINELPLAA